MQACACVTVRAGGGVGEGEVSPMGSMGPNLMNLTGKRAGALGPTTLALGGTTFIEHLACGRHCDK